VFQGDPPSWRRFFFVFVLAISEPTRHIAWSEWVSRAGVVTIANSLIVLLSPLV
jgi:hypothetical protein